MFADIMEIFVVIAHLVSTCVRVALPGGVRAVIAESLHLKHQLLILNRSRKRGPSLTPGDQLLFSASVPSWSLRTASPGLRLESGLRRCCAFIGR
jgi:hypothetical protein